MDAIDRYIERLGDPSVRAFNRKLNGLDEDGPEPAHSNVTEDHIEAAEEALGVALPPSYRKLVLTVQPFDAEYGLYWIRDDKTDPQMSEIVYTNRGPLTWWPSFLIAVLGPDGGDEYCFDTRSPDERGEYPIVHLDHEIHNKDSTEFETVAKDLGEFLFWTLGDESVSE